LPTTGEQALHIDNAPSTGGAKNSMQEPEVAADETKGHDAATKNTRGASAAKNTHSASAASAQSDV
jgi:hypothetical protein